MAEETPSTGHQMTHEQARDDALSAMLGWLPGYTDGTEDRPQHKIVLLEEMINGGVFRWLPAHPHEEYRYANPEGDVFRIFVFAERVPPEEAS